MQIIRLITSKETPLRGFIVELDCPKNKRLSVLYSNTEPRFILIYEWNVMCRNLDVLDVYSRDNHRKLTSSMKEIIIMNAFDKIMLAQDLLKLIEKNEKENASTDQS